MEQSNEEGELFIARRLMSQIQPDAVGSSIPPEKEVTSITDRGVDNNAQEIALADIGEVQNDITSGDSPTKFAKVEKSLASLGFFTPASRRAKNQQSKRINFTREVDGRRVEASAEIIPSAKFGLPVTADQDKYLALQAIITNILQTKGKVENPIRFHSAELLRLLKKNTKSGTNYKEISEWLDVMTTTTIFSEGAVYVAGRSFPLKDRFHVFERAVTVGNELEDGTIADANYIWLSSWQLQNINNNYLLPLDLDTYRQLKNYIAKALVPLLQVWLFASYNAGAKSFEKRYDELCSFLSLQTYRQQSLILRQFKPSLDELTRHGYLANWRIEKTSDGKAYKIILFHGPKFHRDRRRRLDQKNNQLDDTSMIVGQWKPEEPNAPEPGSIQEPKPTQPKTKPVAAIAAAAAPTELHTTLLDELSSRGVAPSVGIKLLQSFPSDRLELVRDYIDYWDSIKKTSDVRPGLLLTLIKEGSPLPANFETHEQRQTKQRAEERREQQLLVKNALTAAYDEHRWSMVDTFIQGQIGTDEFERRVEERKKAVASQGELWEKTSPQLADTMARHEVRAKIAQEVSILPYDEFRRRELPRILAELSLKPEDIGLDATFQPTSGGTSAHA